MKPADDPTFDYKSLVQRGYDRCLAAYDEARKSEAGPELDFLTRRLEDGAAVLDVGCGTGVPYTRALAQRFTVTGVDSSSEMIKQARANVPKASFIHGDVMSVEFPPSSFNGAIAFYSVFHLPREEHPKLFRNIYDWLLPGGYFLCTLTRLSEEAYTEDDFFGVTMYWSNYGLEEYKEILTRVGFSILGTSVIGHGYTEAHQAPHENHPLVLAQKQPTGRGTV
ncbi:MAG: class I SAM-dependent methyltransferase [Chloroflexi bacterium]|nr:class I SAM-dependent methyltransferase [Chloroflexota bacterium]